MIVSVTERQTYMRCRQMWEWASFNREAWQPIFTKPALAIGRLWHATQAEWSLKPEEDPNQLVLTLANAELDRVREAYFQNVGAPISEMELEPIYEQMGMVIAMVHNYHQRWGTPLPEGFHMVMPEQTCLVPIPGTEHECEVCCPQFDFGCNHQFYVEEEIKPCSACNGTGKAFHQLEGTLDGLIADQYGRVYVLERKTYGSRPTLETLNMADQFLAYLWILDQLKLGDLGGLAYDGAWKRKSPPRGSELNDLFLRLRLTRSRNELVNFEVQLAAQVNEMASNPPIYINRQWAGCWDCDFQQPCVAKLRGEDYRFLLTTKYAPRPVSEHTTRELKYADV